MLLKLTLFILGVGGFNPFSKGIFARVRLGMFCIGLTFYITGMCLRTVQCYEGIPTLIRLSDGLPGALQGIWKVAVMIQHRGQLAKAIELIKSFWSTDTLREDARQDVDGMVNQFRRLIKGYYLVTLFVYIEYFCSPLVIGSQLLPMIFVMEGVYPYHIYMYVFLCVFCLPLAFVVVAFDGLFIYCVAHIVKEFRIIRYLFNENLEPMSTVTFEENVRHHGILVGLVKNISDIYQFTFMAMISTTFCYICFGLFLMTRNGMPPSLEDVSKYGVLICFSSLQIVMYCVIGQLLVDESLKIADVFFYKDWPLMKPYQNAFGRMMVMRMSQKGQYLTVGGFFALDLQAYTWIMRNVVSFFTFMQALSKKD